MGDDTAILSCGPSGGDNCKKTLCLWYYNFDNIFFQKRGDSSRTLALTRLRHPGHHTAQGSGHELVLALPDPVTCLVLLRLGQVLGPSQLQQRHEHVNKTWHGFVFRDQTHCDVNNFAFENKDIVKLSGMIWSFLKLSFDGFYNKKVFTLV